FLDKLRLDAVELFDHEAGVDPEDRPPLRAYRPDDYNAFVM
ncbi:MAG: 4Fe-4S ferredoxin, partial [Chloroflexi bacterium]|nr:4Fe-4S ferredoxin [Chloroflexota bacterium]